MTAAFVGGCLISLCVEGSTNLVARTLVGGLGNSLLILACTTSVASLFNGIGFKSTPIRGSKNLVARFEGLGLCLWWDGTAKLPASPGRPEVAIPKSSPRMMTGGFFAAARA